ncbi:MAG TPA: hypothetical protein V6C58_17185 [Allocoleopsis sp.]
MVVLSFISCEKSKSDNPLFNNKSEEVVVENLKQSYGLDKFDVSSTNEEQTNILNSLNVSSRLFNKIENNLELTNARLFVNQDENIVLAIFRFKNDINKFYAVKGTFSKSSFTINNEYLYGREMVNSNNGRIILTNNDEALEISYSNGLRTIKNMNFTEATFNVIQVTDCQGNHGGTGFCQREPGESFSACYNAETAEFCDSFISCIALNTNPTVPILIASACSCSATQCPR